MQNESYVWLSLDPIHGVIKFYPREISYKIEQSYNIHTTCIVTACSLGSDFFNATINFHHNNISHFQTTPGVGWDNLFKQCGYRSVRRITLAPESRDVTIFGQQINSEWRIVNNVNESDKTFDVVIPDDVINERVYL